MYNIVGAEKLVSSFSIYAIIIHLVTNTYEYLTLDYVFFSS